MKTYSIILTLFLLFSSQTLFAQESPTAEEVVSGVVTAAEELFDVISSEQKEELSFSFDDEKQKRRWSNLPVSSVPRKGLQMGDLNDEQKGAVLKLVRSTMSERGYQQVLDNMAGDQWLKENGRGRPDFGFDHYYVSILGKPSATTPWMWQFGGHHLGVNATIVGDQITLSPSLTGGQPVDFEYEGRQVRQLAGDEDLAFELVGSLTAEQLKEAIEDDHHTNLVFGPKAKKIEPKKEGIVASKLTAEQQALLIRLIEERVGILNETHTKIAMKGLIEELPQTYFAWFGPTKKGSAATYRVQGPSILIEYSPQHLGGDLTQHTHAMYRDPSNDYGVGFIAD